MTTPREEYLSARFNEFLDRFSPPRSIQSNPKAMQDEADDMLRSVVRFAPREEYGEWIARVVSSLVEGMTTRSWPTVGEVIRACKSVSKPDTVTSRSMVEEAALGRMEQWFEKFGSQLPGHGNPTRTAELIRRGVLTDEREARFKGFDLSEEQRRRALELRTGRAEWRHHVGVTARLRGISEAEAEAQIRSEGREPMDRSRITLPDLSAPYSAEAFGGDAA